jgi:hypothetical protein
LLFLASGESPPTFAAAARLTRDDNPNRRAGDVFGTHHRAAHLEDFKKVDASVQNVFVTGPAQ